FPGPPGGPYEQSEYVHRLLEESAALTGLEKTGQPVILWGPDRFGKTTLVRYLLEHVRRSSPDDVAVLTDLRQLLARGHVSYRDLLASIAEQLLGAVGADEQTFRQSASEMHDS